MLDSESTQPIGIGATAAGTRAYAERHVAAGRHPSAYRALGRTGLTVSGVGFGGYRVSVAEDHHLEALQLALDGGCNLIDTSTNYGDGASERLLGSVLSHVDLDVRMGLVVVSKVGYVQGSNLREARDRERRGSGTLEMVRYTDGCWHCIHPSFIADQLGRTLERTGLARIDGYLLHNPEYFFSDLARRRDPRPLEERRVEFYERVTRAFESLELEVRSGRIGWYGVSSNTLAQAEDRPEATSLVRFLECAERAAGSGAHHFSVAQLPFNLLEPAAALKRVSGGARGRTVLEVAAEAGIGVLCNRPLNALGGGGLTRLADFQLAPPGQRTDRLAHAVARLEAEFAGGLAHAIHTSGGRQTTFDLGPSAVRVAGDLQDAIRWDEYVRDVLSPDLSERVRAIDQALTGPMKAAWQIWLERYVEALGHLLEGLRIQCARSSQRKSDQIARALAPWLPAERDGATLSQKATATILGQTGVTSVLVGMRHRRYVSDTLGVLDWAPIAVPAEALRKISRGGP